jgi:hypothetical protein
MVLLTPSETDHSGCCCGEEPRRTVVATPGALVATIGTSSAPAIRHQWQGNDELVPGAQLPAVEAAGFDGGERLFPAGTQRQF